MNAISAIKTRQSVRNYEKNYKVDEKTLNEILEAASFYPSGMNYQPLKFVVINEQNRMEEIAKQYKYGSFLNECGQAIAVVGNKKSLFRMEDAAAATQSIMVAARSFELGTCWVGSNRDSIEQDANLDEVEKILNLPKDYEILALIALGKPAKLNRRPKRKELKDIVIYNKF